MNRKTAWRIVAAIVAVAALVFIVVPGRDSSDRVTERDEQRIISVSIRTDGSSYEASVPQGSTVYDAMRAASDKGFEFSGKEHPSLGFYIESIGGRAASDGYYWTLYVNGSESDLGASSRAVAEGDIIEWSYEKR